MNIAADGLPQVSDIERLQRNYQKLKQLLDSQIFNIKQTALQLASEDEKSKMFGDLDNSMLTCLAVQDFIQKYDRELQTMKEHIDRTTRNSMNNQTSSQLPVGTQDITELLKSKDLINHLKLATFKSTPKFKEYQKSIKDVNHQGDNDEDDDLSLASQSVNIKCPISQQIFVEPVKNRECGHLYSKASIESYLKNKNQVACPVAGCNKKITHGSYERSAEADIMIAKEIRKQKREINQPTQDITEVN
ncbi:hypothetical protein DLAC_07543 [Tieghemostelium lacteum]|uniref:SP-RING-type domain-containing protein n=1 Tax=Tieghemostelium lacteum TaxID=361077 RepID=A0A151ZCV5_TIELA|nr:hypothetical protein DLAC_07543 [Tieghemostelium lacteum]|eukprot:KYQ91755.1 hypothetical protein DLAC_07543 [Tieghemostelium lacteum]